MSVAKNYTFAFELPATIERCFELFSDPNQLNRVTPDWFDLQPVDDIFAPLSVGAEISYRLRWRGFPLRWTSRIVAWDPPHLLTYEQARGPYISFRHQHEFRALPAGGTEVIDQVTYRAFGGRLVDRIFVRRDLERIFRHRAESARRLLVPPAVDGPRSAFDSSAS